MAAAPWNDHDELQPADPGATSIAGPLPTVIALRVIGQDPAVADETGKILTANASVPWAPLAPGPTNARFQVVDFDASTGVLQPPADLPSDEDLFATATDEELLTDVRFHAQQVYAVAARTLAAFETALGRRLPWAFAGHQLYLVPHAFSEANAYYSADDRALLFGYVPQPGDHSIYTCLSHDVVAHETTHAVLDGLRRRFLGPGLPDQAAFHEGFADVVALLSVFSLRPVVAACLGPADADGRIDRRLVTADRLRSNVLTSVGEQLGTVLTAGHGALRRSAMEPPPANWAASPAYREPHKRGEVLVSVMLDVLIDIWVTRLQPLLAPGSERLPGRIDRARAAEEGAKAAGHLLNMAIRGLDYLPPVEFEFGDFVQAAVLADREVAPDDGMAYRAKLVDGFAAAGIVVPSGTAVNLAERNVRLRYENLNFSAMRTDPDEVFRFLWQNATQLGVDTSLYTHVEAVRPSQRVGPDGLVVVESVANYVQLDELTATEFEARSGRPLPAGIGRDTRLQVFGGGTLVFDQFGRAKLHVVKRLDDWDRQQRRVEYLHLAGLYDTRLRLGFSYPSVRGQAFADLHDPGSDGEAW